MAARVTPATPLILGSQSPRRLELLRALGIPVEPFAVDVDEVLLPGERPDALATRLARQKGAAVLYALGRAAAARPRWMLCADTIVHIGGELLGKPRDADDARRMMRLLSGRTHHVTTGFVRARRRRLRRARLRRDHGGDLPRALAEDEVRRYVATGEGVDKAGGYAIQGLAGAFVRAPRGQLRQRRGPARAPRGGGAPAGRGHRGLSAVTTRRSWPRPRGGARAHRAGRGGGGARPAVGGAASR
jgi:septum formation protein